MKISVVCPTLNEGRFIRGWLQNVRKFADEIIVIDQESTDGTFEFLDMWPDVDVHTWWRNFKPYEWPEHEIRNKLIELATGDWIVPLDADELVGEDFIESLSYLKKPINRYLQIAPWRDLDLLRKRSLFPLTEKKDGKTRWLRNWRGHYPSYIPRVFRRMDKIRYSETGNHCFLQYGKFGKMAHRIPQITKTHRTPFYHLHYLTRKEGNGRDGETDFKVMKYEGTYPKEIELYEGVL